jgi:DNA-binding MarR family transcriptional regulator
MSEQSAAIAEADEVKAELDPHREAWIAIARTHAAVSGRLQEALTAAGLPPLAWFEALAAIDRAPEQRLKMGDLAEALVITRGGLTKLVDRLIKAGLVERVFCETDRRVSYATLLPAGVELLEEMRSVVREEFDTAFRANLTSAEAEALRVTMERIRGSACGTS